MHRELYNLLYSENKELPCPIIPTGFRFEHSYVSDYKTECHLFHRKQRLWLQADEGQAGNAEGPALEVDAIFQSRPVCLMKDI